MNALLHRFCDVAANSHGPDTAPNSPSQPAILPDALPPIIKERLSQALRVNNRDDWKQFAQLCGATALRFFADNDYDPHNADFKACCRLARIGQLRSVECLTQGRSMPCASSNRMSAA